MIFPAPPVHLSELIITKTLHRMGLGEIHVIYGESQATFSFINCYLHVELTMILIFCQNITIYDISFAFSQKLSACLDMFLRAHFIVQNQFCAFLNMFG